MGAGVELTCLLRLYVVEKDVLNWGRWKIGEEEEKKELDEVTLIVCKKLADGWQEIKNGEMTEEELAKKEQEIKKLYDLYFPND